MCEALCSEILASVAVHEAANRNHTMEIWQELDEAVMPILLQNRNLGSLPNVMSTNDVEMNTLMDYAASVLG